MRILCGLISSICSQGPTSMDSVRLEVKDNKRLRLIRVSHRGVPACAVVPSHPIEHALFAVATEIIELKDSA